MFTKNTFIGLLIAVVNLLLSFVILYEIRVNTNQFKKERNEIAKILNFNERLLDAKEAIPLLGDWIWEQKKGRYHQEIELANQAYDRAVHLVGWLILVNFLFGVIVFFLFVKKSRWFAYTLTLVTWAAVALTGGVFSPMLELEAFKENMEVKIEVDAKEMMTDVKSTLDKIPFLGSSMDSYMKEFIAYLPDETYKWHKVYPDKMYFFYENKGIFDVLKTLWRTGNHPIAVIIALFSFLIPTIKLLSSFYLLTFPSRSSGRLQKIISHITKFSMVDVFVIALLITYFTFDELSAGVQTSSNALMGVYFFTVYVLLAMISSFTLEKWLDEQMKKRII